MSVGPRPDSREVLDNDPGLDIDVLRRRRERSLTFLAIGAVVVIASVCAYFALRPKPVDRRVVIAPAQEAVRRAVGDEHVFDFGQLVHVELQGDEEFLVRGEVVAVSSTLEARHYWYDCVVRRQSDGTWGPAQLKLLPQ